MRDRICRGFGKAFWGVMFCSLAALFCTAGWMNSAQAQIELTLTQATPMVRTGRLLCRPYQYQALINMGYSVPDATAQVDRARNRLDPWRIDVIEPLDLHVILVPERMDEHSMITFLEQTGDYEYVIPDWLVAPIETTPNDPRFNEQWHLQRIGGPQAWDLLTDSSNVICAFVDTGIDVTHPDLQPQLVPGYNAVDRTAQADGGQVDDVNGHGTGVAGIAATAGNNGLGGVGVSWSMGLMPIRAANNSAGFAFMSDIINGAVWAAQNGAVVVNVSFAGVQLPTVETTGSYLNSVGVSLVWGADNTHSNYSSFDWDHAIVVSAIDDKDELYSQSSYGSVIDIAAPGEDVLVPTMGGGFQSRTGTSYAAPIIAGTLAMIRSADPSLSVGEAEAVLLDTAQDIGMSGDDNQFGKGLVDLSAAMSAVIDDPPKGDAYQDLGEGSALPPANPRINPPLVRARYYDLPDVLDINNPITMPDFIALAPQVRELTPLVSFDGVLGSTNLSRYAAAQVSGFIDIPVSGYYNFTLRSVGGAKLFIDNHSVVNDTTYHGSLQEREGSLALTAGLHRIQVDYFTAFAPVKLETLIQGPATIKQVIPETMLSFEPHTADVDWDGFVSVLDFFQFLVSFSANDLVRADLNNDGVVDVLDANMFFVAFDDDNANSW